VHIYIDILTKMCNYMHIMSTKIDSLDEEIINLLMQDARHTSIALANELNVDSSTVRRRIRRLLDEKVMHFVALPEPERIGLSAEAVIALNIDHENIQSALEVLRDSSKIRWAAVTSGRYDVIVYVWCYSINDLYQFIETEIAKIEGLSSSETFICMHVEKRP
jgi:Lrp/AsnC family transcriptional regulator for asnA, asnC and gidA